MSDLFEEKNIPPMLIAENEAPFADPGYCYKMKWDGELMCLVDGKPSFETIQRRSLMSNRFKIELEINRHPATFIAFDILYYNGKVLTMEPLEERKKALEKAVTESPRLAVSCL